MNKLQKNTNSSFYYILLLISLPGYLYISYTLERSDTIPLISTYSFLFLLYIVLVIRIQKQELIRFATYFSFFLRLSLLFSLPNLSDDFYRFIWDGRLLNSGINPFIHLPTYYVENPEISPEGINADLYRKLNSPEYFTIYPPVNQLIFWLSAFISPNSITGSVIIIRIFILIAEAGNFHIIKKLLNIYKLPEKNLLIYTLNPLIILELSGNLHFEGLVVFFVLGSVYLLEKNRLFFASSSLALAISTKLIPVIFLPLILSKLSIRKTLYFYLICLMITVLTFLPLFNAEFFQGVSSSFSLYFKKFEFNAGIYYLLRSYGYSLEGYNIIGTAGRFLGLITFTMIIHYAFYEYFNKEVKLPHCFLWTLLIYLAFTTTLHPWYIIPLIAYCLFTNYRFPLIWAFLIFLTYLSYGIDGFNERLELVLAEYLILFTFLVWELGRNYFLKTNLSIR